MTCGSCHADRFRTSKRVSITSRFTSLVPAFARLLSPSKQKKKEKKKKEKNEQDDENRVGRVCKRKHQQATSNKQQARRRRRRRRRRRIKSKKKKANSTRCSRAVTHHSTNPARLRLTSVIGREPVHSQWYDRWREWSCIQFILMPK